MSPIPDDADALVLDHQVLADSWRVVPGYVVQENGQFVPAASWQAIAHERFENATLVVQLQDRPTWQFTSGAMGIGFVLGLVAMAILVSRRL